MAQEPQGISFQRFDKVGSKTYRWSDDSEICIILVIIESWVSWGKSSEFVKQSIRRIRPRTAPLVSPITALKKSYETKTHLSRGCLML